MLKFTIRFYCKNERWAETKNIKKKFELFPLGELENFLLIYRTYNKYCDTVRQNNIFPSKWFAVLISLEVITSVGAIILLLYSMSNYIEKLQHT